MKNKKDISIRSSAAEYLTFVAANGGAEQGVEVRYENLELTPEATIKNFLIVQKSV